MEAEISGKYSTGSRAKPALKSPAAFHGQIRSLERARVFDMFSEYVTFGFTLSAETGAEPSLQATQMKLKRARLADNLNEKIAQRPGPMELVEKNILPVDSSLKEAIIDLIERLKPFQENTNITPPSTIPATTTISSIPVEVTTTTTPTIVLPVHQVAPEMMCSTPPNSPIPFDQSCLQQDGGISEASSEIQKGSSGSPQAPLQVPEEKDRRLHEKERQIEELMRKLEQEQRLVEELKMQLEVEKRGQIDSMSLSPSHTSVSSAPTVLSSNVVKMEGPIQSNCSSTTIPNSILNSQALSAPRPQVVKLEDVTVSSGQPLQLQTQTQLITQIQHQNQVTTSPKLDPRTQHQSQPAPPSLQQFFITHPAGMSQVLGQPQTLLTTTGQAGTQIFVPVSLPNSTTAIQLPSTTVSLQVRQLVTF
ncbi:hypothetical protein GOODEAATRI_025497 [Goodea atripinnis]|uniref:Phosphatase and actin regulator n=1 Tax=Goodea atripinnis TaxID=208336 RepID=A0ABV0PH93_9TELE